MNPLTDHADRRLRGTVALHGLFSETPRRAVGRLCPRLLPTHLIEVLRISNLLHFVVQKFSNHESVGRSRAEPSLERLPFLSSRDEVTAAAIRSEVCCSSICRAFF